MESQGYAVIFALIMVEMLLCTWQFDCKKHIAIFYKNFFIEMMLMIRMWWGAGGTRIITIVDGYILKCWWSYLILLSGCL